MVPIAPSNVVRELHPSIAVLDKPISKREYDSHTKNCGVFLSGFAQSIRSMADMVTAFSFEDIDKMVVDALTNSDPISRGKSAFTVTCWHKMINPFDHKKRGYYIDLSRVEKVIEDDPESLYMYAVMIIKKPCNEIYKKLKAKNAKYAKAYLLHNEQFKTAEAQYGSVDWLFNW